MGIAVWLILIYLIIGLAMVLWDFRKALLYSLQKKNSQDQSGQTPYSQSGLIEAPRFIANHTISTAIAFILLWPYKLLTRR